MSEILEYILANYTWILGVTIIILLAIIGNYADKTDFGQKKEINEKNHNQEIDNLPEETLQKKPENIENKPGKEEVATEQKTTKDNLEDGENKFEDKFEELNQEVEEFLPKKNLIDNDLLDEIDNLSLDKTQKIKLDDIPDLDDVELPKIKNLKSNDEDIWKF